MAKQTLPTNFKDDILAPSMGGKRKFTITDNGDGTYEIEDVTDYTQTGSNFGAGQINATNQAVNESCDKADVIDDLDDIVANQANGKIAGAKAVATLNASLLSILQPTFEEIYNSSLGTVWGAKIGRIAILRWSVIAADSPVRTIRLGTRFAPAQNAALPLTRNGELLGYSWFSRNGSTGAGELEYHTKSGVNETYTGWTTYITYD